MACPVDFPQCLETSGRRVGVQFEVKCLSGARLPVGLLDLEAAPRRLFLTGHIPAGPRVAIVGTRHPTPEARRFAEVFARELSQAGIVVVSGGAEGIDTAAHIGAQHGPTPTLVVAPCGWEHPFPLANRDLFRAIVASGGGYLSAFDGDVPARRHAFFLRNSVMVSICLAVVLIEAPYRSGARNASSWARRLGKPLLVVPHAPWSSQGAGCNAELRLGAELCCSSKDIVRRLQPQQISPPLTTTAPAGQLLLGWLEELNPALPGEASPGNAQLGEHPMPTKVLRIAPSSLLEDVWQLLETGPQAVDALCMNTGAQARDLQRALTTLELEGRIRMGPPGWVRRAERTQRRGRGGAPRTDPRGSVGAQPTDCFGLDDGSQEE
jgi:DNA processing protein